MLACGSTDKLNENIMRRILVEVQIDWEDYDDVCDELLIEDAITTEKLGVTWRVLPQANVIKSVPMHKFGSADLDRCINCNKPIK